MYHKLCIPRVDSYHNKEHINALFRKFDLGTIDKINIVMNAKNGYNTKTAFIYMKEWYTTDKVNKIFKRFENGQDVKLVYKNPFEYDPCENVESIYNSHFYWKLVVAH